MGNQGHFKWNPYSHFIRFDDLCSSIGLTNGKMNGVLLARTKANRSTKIRLPKYTDTKKE